MICIAIQYSQYTIHTNTKNLLTDVNSHDIVQIRRSLYPLHQAWIWTQDLRVHYWSYTTVPIAKVIVAVSFLLINLQFPCISTQFRNIVPALVLAYPEVIHIYLQVQRIPRIDWVNKAIVNLHIFLFPFEGTCNEVISYLSHFWELNISTWDNNEGCTNWYPLTK